MLLWSNNIMAGCRCSVWLWGISLVHVVSVFSHARMLLSDLCSLWALCSLSPADNNRVESVLRPVQLSHTPPGVFRARCQSLLALPPTLNRFDPRYLWTAQNLKNMWFFLWCGTHCSQSGLWGSLSINGWNFPFDPSFKMWLFLPLRPLWVLDTAGCQHEQNQSVSAFIGL